MPLQQSVVSKSTARVDALRAKHKHLSNKIEQEQGRPFISEHILTGLKREKLRIKEQISEIQKVS